MTDTTLQKLYSQDTTGSNQDDQPNPSEPLVLQSHYLNEGIRNQGSCDQPFVYANFVMSLDGRIATHTENYTTMQTPECLTTAADWCLFTQLQAQADCLLTHSGYLRALERGELGNALQVSPESPTGFLAEWRRRQGLAAQPALMVISRTLDFNLPDFIEPEYQSTTVITGQAAPKDRINALENKGIEVIVTDKSDFISATDVRAAVKDRGFSNLYLQTGPDFLHSILDAQLLDRLYLTISLSLIGGDPFLSMVKGTVFPQAVTPTLRTLLLAQPSPASAEPQQLFASFALDKKIPTI